MIRSIKPDEQLCIALVGPFTGIRDDYGKMLERMCNQVSKNYNIRWQIFDDAATPSKAIKCAHNIIDSSASIVVGHLNSYCAEVTAPLYRDNSLPLILPAATKRELTVHENVFRICPHEDIMIAEMERLITHCNGKSVAVYVDGSTYGDYLYQKLCKTIKIENKVVSPNEVICNENYEIIIALGIHHGIAKFINCLNTIERKIDIYCCDDAAIEAFDLLVSNSQHKIHVLRPLGGYSRCSSIALTMAANCISNNEKLSPLAWLMKRGGFDLEREYIDTHYELHAVS